MLEQHNLWVCKPNDFNRGRGVHLFNNVEQLKKLINDYTVGVEIIHPLPKKTSEEI
jgi:glutathione synthase/RimK-type ligase-like ATP-grasp enzyme